MWLIIADEFNSPVSVINGSLSFFALLERNQITTPNVLG